LSQPPKWRVMTDNQRQVTHRNVHSVMNHCDLSERNHKMLHTATLINTVQPNPYFQNVGIFERQSGMWVTES